MKFILLMIGAPEIIFIVLIVLLLFGGKGVKSFKQGMSEMENDVNNKTEQKDGEQK